MKEIKFIEPKTIEAVECALCGEPSKRDDWTRRCVSLARRFDGRNFNALVATPENEEALSIAICDTCTAIACVEWAFLVSEHTEARVAKERLEDYDMLSSGV